ncbi:MAG: phosphotransferase [Gammaproteobacteria bacterium]|nr:phosphotransferase [Gammaproteobacteria bacterium]
MVKYPNLTEMQQQNLPALTKPAQQMCAKFEDSTHQLWHCETIDGPMVLKLCNHDTIKTSSFWQGVNSLFAVDFPDSLNQIQQIHTFLSEHGCLNIPEYIASEASRYVLVRHITGDDAETVSDSMVRKLASHLAQLHRHQLSNWGAFHHTGFSAKQWSERLQHTLMTLAELHPVTIPNNMLEHALEQAKKLNVTMFSPIMLDLRWDQMLHQQGQLSAIVDMDAFVVGPRELELVLLEYQLNKQQANTFEQAYQEISDMPALADQRYGYRLLLFLMNSLGETDIAKWMNAPIWWK